MRIDLAELIWPLVTALSPARAGRRVLGGIVVLAAAVVVLVIATGGGTPRTAPASGTLGPTPVLSGIERTGQVSLARDCGYSAPLPAVSGHSLWLFCDTPVYVKKAGNGGSWSLQRFITGSTAAEGQSVAGASPDDRVPGPLTEVRSPRLQISFTAGGAPASGVAARGAPAEFLGPPGGLVTSYGLPCADGGGYAASWASGVARVPSSPYLLITFTNYCVLGGTDGFLPEGFGLAEYDPATGTLSHEVTVFSGLDLSFHPSAKLLGSPVFSGGYLYLFGPTCTALASGRCATGTLFEARVQASPAAWGNSLSYRWWTGKNGPFGPWTPDPGAAASIITGARPSAVSVSDFSAVGHHLVLVEQTSINGAFTVYQSAGPVGPWRKVRSGRVACGSGTGFANFCRAIIGHPELSTPTQLVLSYFDPAAGARGHVMVAGFRW
jgi:hypothetical protein